MEKSPHKDRSTGCVCVCRQLTDKVNIPQMITPHPDSHTLEYKHTHATTHEFGRASQPQKVNNKKAGKMEKKIWREVS